MMNKPIQALGKVIRRAREEKNLSQAALAEKVGIGKHTVMNIENYRGNPKLEVIFRLIRELEIPADLVFFPEDSQDSEEKQKLIRAIQNCSEEEIGAATAVLHTLLYVLRTHHTEMELVNV